MRLKKISSWIVLLFSMFSTTVLFQNCSSGFKTSGDGSFSDSSILSAPEVTFVNSLDLYATSSITLQFQAQIAANDSFASATCQVDTGPLVDCSTRSMTLNALADGDHSFTVVVQTSRGQRTEARKLFRKDTTGPVINVSMTPSLVTNQTTGVFTFTVTDQYSLVQSVECSVDNAAFAACASPVTLSGLTAGAHTFRLRAQDAGGNVSNIYAYNWTVDLTAPTVTLSAMPPAITNQVNASFSFSGAGIVSYECQLDNLAFAACTSPVAFANLAATAHTFRVRGTSQAGNVSAVVAYNWTLDNVVPTAPNLMANVTAISALRTASFNFSSTDLNGIAGFQCSLDNGAFAACVSPQNLSALADGNHSFRVRASDNAGNLSVVSTFNWLVDATNPVIAFTQTPPATTTATTATFAFTVNEPNVMSVQCSFDNAAFANCTSPVNLANVAVSATAHTFRVQARDTAGNMATQMHSWIVSANAPPPPPPPTGSGLIIDLSYVNQASPQYTRFKTMVDAALAGNPDYGFEPQHAAYMYRITGETRYCDYAITFAENCANSRYAEPNCGVQGAEASIAAGGRPFVSGDSYLEVGPIIGSLAITYDWCAARMTSAQRTRWAAYANQAIYNVWHPTTASWGGRSYPWSGWSIDNPGNNYYYSFLEATMYWALATQDATLLNFLRTDKLRALTDYYARIPGGGSLEGTGYGAAHMRLFQLYQVWKDSTGEDMANMSSHLSDSIRFWVHATTPNRAYYAPVGDLARSSFPDLFDYHRRIMLEARRLTLNSSLQNLASWWLSHISVTEMSRRIDGQWDLLPAGTNAAVSPDEPLFYHATGVGRIFTRTGWDTGALWLSFNAGAYNESHAHQDQGSFTLANNAFLAVTNNIYSNSGINQTTDYHNIVRFVQNGTVIGQREGTTSSMTINSQNSTNGDLNVTANLTPAYGGNANIQNWTRNLQFAQRRLTVTDQFSVSNGTQGVFQIQVPVQPVISGSNITAGNLRIRVVSPANPVITVVNQERFRIDISGGATGYVVELSDQ